MGLEGAVVDAGVNAIDPAFVISEPAVAQAGAAANAAIDAIAGDVPIDIRLSKENVAPFIAQNWQEGIATQGVGRAGPLGIKAQTAVELKLGGRGCAGLRGQQW